MRRSILSLLIALAPLAHAQEKRAEVLVLGTFHMANPGRDIFNTQVDDMLAPKRQQEIAELATVLARFKPTKIAVENDSQSRLSDRYARYLAGQYTLTTNEIDQIGLRLAKEMGHTAIYAVDADGDFPFPRVVNFAKATGQSAKLDGWLRQDVSGDPTLRLRKLEELVR